jgi:hypothetical protein
VNRIAIMTDRERAEIFSRTAARKGVADAIVEKDFWVCWVLMHLFTIDALEGRRAGPRDALRNSARKQGVQHFGIGN